MQFKQTKIFPLSNFWNKFKLRTLALRLKISFVPLLELQYLLFVGWIILSYFSFLWDFTQYVGMTAQ